MGIYWSRWRDFIAEEFNLIPQEEGVYQFRCIAKDGVPKPVSRLKRVDSEGIIYIGMSGDLRYRIKAFWTTITQKDRTRHAAGWTFYSFNYYPVFPKRNLQFRFLTTKAASELEFDLLLKYFKKFTDFPPLNVNRVAYPKNWGMKMKRAFGRKPLPE